MVPPAAVPAEATAVGGADVIGALRKDLWEQFPLYLYYIYALGMQHLVLASLDPPAPTMAWTMLAPLAVFVIAQEARLRVGPSQGRAARRAWLGVAVVGGPALIWLIARPFALSDAVVRAIYEWTNLGWAALLMLWLLRTRPAGQLGLYFGALFAVGLVLENGGIAMGYFEEVNYHVQVPGLHAPLATMLGWSMVMLMGLHVAFVLQRAWPALGRNPLTLGTTAAVAITALDVQIDPIASRVGCWRWVESAPPWLFEVPFLNFAAWLSALVPIFTMVLWVAHEQGFEPQGPWSRAATLRVLLYAPACLFVCLVCFLGIMTLWDGGVDGPAWSVFGAFLADPVDKILGR